MKRSTFRFLFIISIFLAACSSSQAAITPDAPTETASPTKDALASTPIPSKTATAPVVAPTETATPTDDPASMWPSAETTLDATEQIVDVNYPGDFTVPKNLTQEYDGSNPYEARKIRVDISGPTCPTDRIEGDSYSFWNVSPTVESFQARYDLELNDDHLFGGSWDNDGGTKYTYVGEDESTYLVSYIRTDVTYYVRIDKSEATCETKPNDHFFVDIYAPWCGVDVEVIEADKWYTFYALNGRQHGRRCADESCQNLVGVQDFLPAKVIDVSVSGMWTLEDANGVVTYVNKDNVFCYYWPDVRP